MYERHGPYKPPVAARNHVMRREQATTRRSVSRCPPVQLPHASRALEWQPKAGDSRGTEVGAGVVGRHVAARAALLAIVLPVVAALLEPQVSSVALPAAAQPNAFFDPLDGSPSSPQPWRPDNWDVTVHSRDRDTWKSLNPMQAHHGADCAPPPAVHEMSAYEDAVFLCRDHLMTAIRGDGYGAIYLTPNQMLDFSAGEAVLRFDMSTLRTSDRDWVDIWITPFADNLQAPLDDWLPDLNGVPRNAVHIRMDDVAGETVFRAFVVHEFRVEPVPGSSTGYERFLTPSAIQRDTFELRLSRTHLSFGMPDFGYRWVDASVSDLVWTRGVVQLAHHSYNPTKGTGSNAGGGTGLGAANTWHWDNVSIAPAMPFTMLRADRRFVDATTPPRVAFSAAAPHGAHLRFAGIGENLELSVDGGATWQPALKQAQMKAADEHFKSYWTPIPAGVDSVQFRGSEGWFGPWMVRDIAIWAL